MSTLWKHSNAAIMGRAVHSTQTPSEPHTRRSKVKSGCRTCKIRKVKCDEGRPACSRCISTGRVCDGYGVWGGGGNFTNHRQCFLVSGYSRPAPQLPICASIAGCNVEEKGCFEWFMYRTAKKIPGIFISTFWDTLIVQSSMAEPAIFDAVLTLSSVHKYGIVNVNNGIQSRPGWDEQELFILQHYNKAIGHLQPHFLSNARTSVRIALITCVIFVYLEFLRGGFRTAQAHLQSGLKVLRENYVPYNMKNDDDDEIHFLDPSCDSIDCWIIEAYSRLYIQVQLFKQYYQPQCLLMPISAVQCPSPVFHCINVAWQHLERVLNKIIYLTEKGCRQQIPKNLSEEVPSTLLDYRQNIRNELAQWLDAVELSKRNFQSNDSGEFAFLLLLAYHAMATIMAETCLYLKDESVYDSHTETFVSLLRKLAKVWEMRSPISHTLTLPSGDMNMSRSIVDIGWIPPLYYTALKCRVHRVRTHAIRLIESTTHREGIWDANIASKVSRKVMQIEERNFYGDVDANDDFSLFSSPDLQDLSLPVLPQSYRIREVKVVLPNDPSDSIGLSYEQKQESGEWKVLAKEYNAFSRSWTGV